MGDPGWLTDELYDVVAKVEQADLADWQKPAMRQTMLRAMMQAMLAERCKVVVHYGSKEAPVYDLVIAKGGPKFKQAETVDTAELRRKHPDGGMMRGSGTMAVQSRNRTQFYAISMAILANTILPSVADRASGRQDRLGRVLRSCAAIVGPTATAVVPSSRCVAAAGCATPTTRR